MAQTDEGKTELFQSEVRIEHNADGVEADLGCIQGSDKVYGQREEEHPLAQIKEECLWSPPNSGVRSCLSCLPMFQDGGIHYSRCSGQRSAGEGISWCQTRRANQRRSPYEEQEH